MSINETLFKAVESGNPENVKAALLTEKIVATTYFGAKSVIYAVEKGYAEILEMLLESGSKIPRLSFWANSYNIAISTLPKAVKDERIDIVKLLFAYGAAVNKKQLKEAFFDAFILALKSQHLEMIKLFIDAGVNVNLKSKNGDTPLMYAILVKNENQEKLIELLLEGGANVNARDTVWEKEGRETRKIIRTPLTLAKQQGNEKVIELLKNAKNNPKPKQE
jgi:ankyrin repeat protein